MSTTINANPSITIGKSKEYITKILNTGGFNQSIYLEGPSGIGKSEVVIQLAVEQDAILIDLRLGQLDTIDLNGIGIPDIANNRAIFTRPEFFPPENCEKKYVLFLDEFNHASEQVFGAAYQLVLERRVGVHKLPKNVLIIGAGNSVSDNGISFSMPSPLQNRFMKINVRTDSTDWLSYASEQNIDWRILAFIKTHPEFLHKFDPKTNEDNFPTPRNWFKSNNFIADKDPEFLRIVLNSLFGIQCTISLTTFLALLKQMPKLTDILEGKKNVSPLGVEIESSYGFYMLFKNYLKNTIESITVNEVINVITYAQQQSNSEIMELLCSDVINFCNNNLDKERKNTLKMTLLSNPELVKSNKQLINRLQNLAQSTTAK